MRYALSLLIFLAALFTLVAEDVADARARFRQGDTRAARAIVTRMLRANPTNSRAYHALGDFMLADDAFGDAVALVEEWFPIDPSAAYAFAVPLALALTDTGRERDARAFSRFIADVAPAYTVTPPAMLRTNIALLTLRYPDASDVFRAKGALAGIAGAFDAAEEAYLRAIDHGANTRDVYMRLGDLFYDGNDPLRAATYYTMARDEGGDRTLLTIRIAHAYEKANDDTNAARAYEALLQLDTRSAYPAIRLATLALRMNAYDRAHAALALAEERAPTNENVFLLRGNVLLRTGLYDAALASFERAVALGAKSVKVYTFLGDTFFRDDAARADTFYARAIAAAPLYTNAYERRVRLAMHHGEYTNAIIHATNALTQFPHAYHFALYAGKASLALDDKERALAFFSRVSVDAKEFAATRVLAGKIAYNRGNFADAKAAFRIAGAKGEGETRAEAYYCLGKTYRAEGDVSSARAAFALVPEASAHFPLAMRCSADAYYAEGAYDAARTAYKHLLRVRPHETGVYFFLGNIAYQEGDTASALAAYRRVATSAREYYRANMNAAKLAFRTGSYWYAKRCAIRARRKDASRGEAHVFLGDLYAGIGAETKALSFYRDAQTHSPRHVAAYIAESSLYRALARMEHAQLALARGLRMAPSSRALLEAEGDIYAATKAPFKAAASYNRAFAYAKENATRFRLSKKCADTLYASSNMRLAQEYYEQAFAYGEGAYRLRMIAGMIDVSRGRYRDAFETFSWLNAYDARLTYEGMRTLHATLANLPEEETLREDVALFLLQHGYTNARFVGE